MGKILRIGFLALLVILVIIESARALVGTLGHISITLVSAGNPAASPTAVTATPSSLPTQSGRPTQTPGLTATPIPTRMAVNSTPAYVLSTATATEAVPPISTLYARSTSDGRRVPWPQRFDRKGNEQQPGEPQQPTQPATALPDADPSLEPQPTNAPTGATVETQPPVEGPEAVPTEAPLPQPTDAPPSAPVETQPPVEEPEAIPTEAPPPLPTYAP